MNKIFPELSRTVHDKQLVYLDNAATTLKPTCVIEKMHEYMQNDVANIHRGVHYLSEVGTIAYEATRDAVKEFINASSREEIIFTRGTTEAINLVATCFCRAFINEGDSILITDMEHHSNIVPWQLQLPLNKGKLKAVKFNARGELDLDDLKAKLTSDVKLLSICHISNTLGTINPIKEIIKLAHANGTKVLVDCAQSIAHVVVDVQDLDADFIAFSGHKIYGPTGVGVLYGKKELLDAMPPYMGGGDMINEVTIEKTTYNDLPHKFEAGTPAIAEVIAFKAALDFVKDFTMKRIIEIEDDLTKYATEQLLTIDGLRIIGTAQNKTGICSFVIDGIHHHDLGTLLDQMGIAVRTGHHCTQPLLRCFSLTGTTRASFALYNTHDDIDRLVAGINKAKTFL